MAFTASLDNTYATDAQLYQLYAETASIKAEIAGIEAYTASLKGAAIVSSSTQVQNYDLFALNSNLYNSTGSLIGITNGIMALTASMKAAAIVSSSTQIQNYDVFALNSNLYTSTGSLIGITNGIMALTASMKAAAIVSSSTQIQNYFTFAQTASVNTFYGNQIITGGLDVRDGVTGSFKGNLAGTATSATNLSITNASTNTNYALLFTTAGSNGFLSGYTDAFGGMLWNPSTNKLTISGSAEISGSFNVYGGNITGSILSTNGVVSSSAQIEELSQIAGIESYTASLKAAAIVSSSTQIQNYNTFALTSSANTFWGTQTFSGSLLLSGSMLQSGVSTLVGNTVLSGSIAMSGSTVQTGNNTLIGNTTLSGSINVSGSSTFRNSIFIVTGSSYFTGSHDTKGNTTITGSLGVTGITTMSSSLYLTGSLIQNNTAQTNVLAVSLVNPSAAVIHAWPTASYAGASYMFAAVEDSTGKATSYNILVAQGNNKVTNIQTYLIKSEGSSPVATITTAISNGSVELRITDTGTFTYRGIVQLF
jgi:hypothetical protein